MVRCVYPLRDCTALKINLEDTRNALTLKAGGTLYAKAFGNRVLGDSTKPMGLDSVAWLASCSKVCVAY